MTSYAVTDPATGRTLATYPVADDAAIEQALASASRAQRSWAETSVRDRATVVSRVAGLHRRRRDELARIIGREMGKPLDAALDEVEFTAAIYDYYATHAADFLADEPVSLLDGEGTAVVRKAPFGVLLGVMPWNFPYYQVARFAAPNLMAGNTVVLKHAPQCPESAAAIQQVFDDAGSPRGTYVDVRATNDQVAAMVADPRVAGVSLTGSERAGAAVAEIAGRNLKKVVLELGGSDPFIVLSTDDLVSVVDAAVSARLDNAGQSCNAAKRFIVHEDLYDDFLDRFTTAMLAAADGLAPLSSVDAARRLDEQVTRAVEGGAALASAGPRRGAWFPPAVLTHVERDNPAFHDELFGPVAMVFGIDSEDAALELANDSPYGLGAYVFTTDAAQAERVADRLEAGMVFVNGVLLDGVELPFGGVKRSGFGRELGRSGIEEFVNRKLVRTLR